MRTRFRLAWIAALTFVLASAPFAQERDDGADDRGGESTARPEHRVRPLPADTFKPSEDISEDYPVPFPVDI